MFKYLELCVDLKKSHIAKEGLFQYRNMCQLTNVASLASVVQGTQNYSTTIIKIVKIVYVKLRSFTLNNILLRL